MFPTVVESLAVKLTIRWPKKFFGDWPVRPGCKEEARTVENLSLFISMEGTKKSIVEHSNSYKQLFLRLKFLKKKFKFVMGFRHK
jgi:hypothetical protein